jgi:hypothetical protein
MATEGLVARGLMFGNEKPRRGALILRPAPNGLELSRLGRN